MNKDRLLSDEIIRNDLQSFIEYELLWIGYRNYAIVRWQNQHDNLDHDDPANARRIADLENRIALWTGFRDEGVVKVTALFPAFHAYGSIGGASSDGTLEDMADEVGVSVH